MKNQKYGTFYFYLPSSQPDGEGGSEDRGRKVMANVHGHKHSFETRGKHFSEVIAGTQLADYIGRRINGQDEDSPHSKLPGDGTCVWIQGQVDGNMVFGEKGYGEYHYKVRYDEGPGDKAWMEERDWNYIQRIIREDLLLHFEPDADKEIAKDHKYYVEITRALKEARDKRDQEKHEAEDRSEKARVDRMEKERAIEEATKAEEKCQQQEARTQVEKANKAAEEAKGYEIKVSQRLSAIKERASTAISVVDKIRRFSGISTDLVDAANKAMQKIERQIGLATTVVQEVAKHATLASEAAKKAAESIWEQATVIETTRQADDLGRVAAALAALKAAERASEQAWRYRNAVIETTKHADEATREAWEAKQQLDLGMGEISSISKRVKKGVALVLKIEERAKKAAEAQVDKVRQIASEAQNYPATVIALIHELTEQLASVTDVVSEIEALNAIYSAIAVDTKKQSDVSLSIKLKMQFNTTAPMGAEVRKQLEAASLLEEEVKKQVAIINEALQRVEAERRANPIAVTAITAQAEVAAKALAEAKRLTRNIDSALGQAKSHVASAQKVKERGDQETQEEKEVSGRKAEEKRKSKADEIQSHSDVVTEKQEIHDKERRELQEQIKKLGEEIAKRDLVLQAKAKELEEAEEFSNSLQDDRKTLEQKLEQAQARSNSRLITTYQKQLEALQQQLTIAQEEKSKIAEDHHKLEKEQAESTRQNTEILKTIQGQISQLTGKIVGVQDSVHEIGSVVEGVRDQLTEESAIEREGRSRQEQLLQGLEEKLKEYSQKDSLSGEDRTLLEALQLAKKTELEKVEQRNVLLEQPGYPQLKEFYLSIRRLLNSGLKADELEATGEFHTCDTTRKEKASSVVKVISRFIPLVGTVLDAAGIAVKSYAEKSKKAKAQYVAGLAPDTFARETMVEEIAFGLCEHYERQLKGLTSPNEIERKAVINRLAEVAVKRIRGYLQKGAALEPDPVTALVRAVRVTKIKRDRKIAITEKSVSDQHDAPSLWLDHWTAHGFFSQSGIRAASPHRTHSTFFDFEAPSHSALKDKRTADKIYYTDVERYGYAEGTMDDARIAGMEQKR